MGVTLLEMLCGEISAPPCNQTQDPNGKHAYGWKLVESKLGKLDVWKASWAVAEQRNGKAVIGRDEETSLPIPACPQAKHLVQALLVDFETIEWSRIWKLYKAFDKCTSCKYDATSGKNLCNSRRRLIERFIRASE